MAHDPERGLTVLFGGLRETSDRPAPSDETWVFDGRSWRRVDVRRRPAPRHRAAMVWDPRARRCVLYGGQTRRFGTWPMLNDAWAFDGAQWTRAEGWFRFWRPRARCAHHLAFDGVTGRVVLFGGSVGQHTVADTWTFEGGGWTRRRGPAPSAREYGAMAYDASRQACFLYGGSPDDEGTQGSFADTWRFDEGGWRRVEVDQDAGPRDDFVLAFFGGQLNALVLSGSRQPSYTAVLGSSGWRRVEIASPEPSPRQCAAMVYRDDSSAGLLHGGELHHGGELFSDTWLLHPPT